MQKAISTPATDENIRRSGISVVGDVPWGTHLCQFYRTEKDLIDILVPYFIAGLENNEYCMWVTSKPLEVEDAKAALRKLVRNLDDYLDKGQIEFLNYTRWYTKEGTFEPDHVLQGWLDKEKEALERGFAGLRLSGDTLWVAQNDWERFADYEATVDGVVGNHRVIALCCYALKGCGAREIIDAVNNHQFAMIRHEGKWSAIESCERRRAQEAARESGGMLRALIENVPDAIFIHDLMGNFVDGNRKAEELIGYAKEELIGKNFFEAGLIPEARVLDVMKGLEQSSRGEMGKPCELELITKQGSRVWVEVAALAIAGKGNVQVLGIARDITERKRAEQALRQSEEKLRLMFESIQEGIVVADLEGHIVDANRAAVSTLGYRSKREVVGRSAFEFVAEKDRPRAVDDVRKRLERRRYRGLREYTLVTANGRELVAEFSAALLDDGFGNATGLIGVVRDITERKRIEEVLRESEHKYRVLFEGAIDGVSVIDAKTMKVVLANQNATKMYGFDSAEDAIGVNPLDFIHPDDRERVLRIIVEDMFEKDLRQVNEFRTIAKDGKEKWISAIGTAIEYEGKLAGLVSIRDITERKRMEEVLRESEEISRGMVESAAAAIYIVQDGKFQYVSPQIEDISGYTSDEMTGTDSLMYIHPEDRGAAKKAVIKNLKGENNLPHEFRFIRKDGQPIWILEKVASIQYRGEPAAVGSLLDITERKRAEQELIRLSNAVKMSNDSIVIYDLEVNILDVNEATLKMYGTNDKSDLVGKNALELIAPEDRERAIAGVKEVMENGYNENHEYHIITKNGGVILVAMNTALMKDEDGTPTGFVGVSRDITERKRAEQALSSSEERYRRLLDDINDGYVVLQGERAVFANKRCAEISGYSLEEIVGQPASRFLASEALEKALKVAQRSISGEAITGTHESVIVQKDGTKVPVEFSLRDIIYEGKPAVCAIIRDITKRKRAQEETERHTRRAEALYAIAHTVSQTLDTDIILEYCLTMALELIDAELGGIYLMDFGAGQFALKAQVGVSEVTVASIGIIELDEEEINQGLGWKEPVFEPAKVFSEANLAMITTAIKNAGVRAHIIVPFWSKGVPLGAFVVASRHKRQFSAEDVELLRAIGDEIAVGVENARLLERTRELSVTDELTGLYNRRHFYGLLEAEVDRTQRYGRSFSLVMLDIDGFKEYNDRFGHTNGDAVLQSLAQTLKSALRKSDMAFRYGGDEFAVILPMTDAVKAKKIVDRVKSRWLPAPKLQYLALESPLGFSAGIAEFPRHAETIDGLVFLADAALYHAKRDGRYGVVLVSDLEMLPPDVRSMATLDQVYALAATVDAKDPYTYGHSTRVAVLAEMVGRALLLSGNELSDLYAAALLHDIGKIGVPDAILTKPGQLTEDEWRIVKKHCAEGARIFGYVKELRGSLPMILHHHEWYDGSGYPARLKSEGIPLGARIIAVADAYDTMTTPRTYRGTMSEDEAIEELRRCSGTQFDPEVVEAFYQATSLDTILEG